MRRSVVNHEEISSVLLLPGFSFAPARDKSGRPVKNCWVPVAGSVLFTDYVAQKKVSENVPPSEVVSIIVKHGGLLVPSYIVLRRRCVYGRKYPPRL